MTSTNKPASASALLARAQQDDGGNLTGVSAELTDAIKAVSRVRTRVAALRSEAQVADILDGGETPGAYERVFQTLAAMDREVGNLEAATRNVIAIQRQLDTVLADLEPAPSAPPAAE